MLVAGQACLIVALASAVYGIGASVYGARARRREWVASGRRAVYAMAGATAVAFVLLEIAFVRSDFSSATVASHSSTTTPLFYRLTAMWSYLFQIVLTLYQPCVRSLLVTRIFGGPGDSSVAPAPGLGRTAAAGLGCTSHRFPVSFQEKELRSEPEEAA